MSNHTQQNLLHAYLDRELDLVRSMELEDHLVDCSDCAREVASFRALRESVIGADLRYRAPADFRARLLSELQQAQQPQTRPEPTIVRRSIPWWSWAAVAACLLLAAGTFLVDMNRRAERTLATQIVADHVRSLMATHLTDVLTSDQHTVKPWFTGKLDFSPQVRDLTPQGFDLIGGRLDYVEGRNVAAIVYQRRKHVINLFTWPAAENDEQ